MVQLAQVVVKVGMARGERVSFRRFHPSVHCHCDVHKWPIRWVNWSVDTVFVVT